MGVRMTDVSGERGRKLPDLAAGYNQKKTQNRQPKAKPNSLPASGLLSCPRKMALRIQGHIEPYSPASPWLSEGQMHEEEIIRTLREIGFRITQTGAMQGWFTTQLSGIKIRGQADGVLPEIPAILEIKSVGQETKLMAMKEPKFSWKAQTEIYMRTLDLPATLLFAKARDTGRARQWIWRRDNELWKMITDHVSLVSAIKNPWEHDVKRSWECSFCSWKEKCWGKPLENIQIGEGLVNENQQIGEGTTK